MKKKILFLLLGLFLLCGCSKEPEKVEKKAIENPIIVDEAAKVFTKYQKGLDDETNPVKGFFIEYVFEDNFCSKAIYHTEYKNKQALENNQNACLQEPDVYVDPYVDDDGMLVYEYTGDALIGKSVRYVLTYLQGSQGVEVEIEYE